MPNTNTIGITRNPRSRQQIANRERIDPNFPVQGYFDNVLNYHTRDNAKRCFGVELEYATKKDRSVAAAKVYEIVKSDAILTADGSIGTYLNGERWDGAEIVTRPMVLENQIKFWTNFIKNKPADVKSDEPKTCGLHIHVSRDSISPLTLGKVLVFMNDSQNDAFIRNRFARRSSKRWAKKVNKAYGVRHLRSLRDDRYERVNLTPVHTIEFRLFQGTTGKRLLSCIEFVASLIQFCEQTSIQNINYVEYCKWVAKQPAKLWPNLQDKIANGGAKKKAIKPTFFR